MPGQRARGRPPGRRHAAGADPPDAKESRGDPSRAAAAAGAPGPATTGPLLASTVRAGLVRTPAELRKAGRPDAVRALAAAPAAADVGQELLERVRAMSSYQARELLATIALQLGLRLQAEPAPGRERRQGV